MSPLFNIKMLIYPSKAKLDEKILFDENIHLYNQKLRKIHVKGLYCAREFHISFWSVHDLLDIEI